MKMATAMRRKLWKLCYGCRYPSLLVAVPVWLLLVWISWMVSGSVSDLLRPPAPPDKDLSHFRRSRSLRHYLDNIELLIEPSFVSCSNEDEVPVFVMVTSSPGRVDHRQAIRDTWGKHLPTYFILGLDGTRNDNQLIDNYIEAKQYSDMVVYDFKEHYQNLTLKTGLMLKWTLDRCPQAQFLYKTDDDMLINPWLLKQVLKERGGGAKVLGFVHNNSWLHRDEYNKWYLPRWLCSEDLIAQYTTGPGYLIRGELIREILTAAKRVPLHNMEDVYFTYNVAKKALGFELTHDDRLSCYRPHPQWLAFACAYWDYASVHSLAPDEILRIWSSISEIKEKHSRGESVCVFYNTFVKIFVAMY